MRRTIGEFAIAFTFLAIALAAIALAWRMPPGTVALPGPRVVPTALAIILALTGLALMIRAVRRAAPDERVALAPRDVVVAFLALVAVTFGFERLGAAPTLAVLLFVILRYIARQPAWRAALAALVGAAAAWLVFANLLGVTLPRFPF